MKEFTAPIQAVNGQYWSSSGTPGLQLGSDKTEQFVINTDWPYNNGFCTIRSVTMQKYLRWNDGAGSWVGPTVGLSDVDASTNWNDIPADVQKTLTFYYSEDRALDGAMVQGLFSLQIDGGDVVKVVNLDNVNYLATSPDVDDFSLFYPNEYIYSMQLRTNTDGRYWKVLPFNSVGLTADASDADWFLFNAVKLTLRLADGRNLKLSLDDSSVLVAGDWESPFTFGLALGELGLQFQTSIQIETTFYGLTTDGLVVCQGTDTNDPSSSNPAFWFAYSGCDPIVLPAPIM